MSDDPKWSDKPAKPTWALIGDNLFTVNDDKSLTPAKIRPVKYKVNGRPVTITGFYEGEGRGDESGLFYVFDDTPDTTHWMSHSGAAVRMEPMENDDDNRRTE